MHSFTFVSYFQDPIIMEYKGTLIPVGGNEDKGMGLKETYCLDFIKQGILSTIVKESGGTNANIVVITTASSIPKVVGENYLKAFDSLGCNIYKLLIFVNIYIHIYSFF